MRSVLASTMAMMACLTLAGCGSDDSEPMPTPTPTPVPTPTPTPPACPSGTTRVSAIRSASGAELQVCALPGLINADLALPKLTDTVYLISGRVYVGSDVGADGTAAGGNPVTLTIAPGVTLYGISDPDRLIVNRGSRIEAVGTASAPIIFTSLANITHPLTDIRPWGGLLLLGRAPINNCDNAGATGGSTACEAEATGVGGKYGGAAPDDNSGSLRYVQIRNAGGGASNAGSEFAIAGLSLAGVGYASTLDHIQIHFSALAGLKLIGGRASLRYVAVSGADEDGLIARAGHRGSIQYFASSQYRGTGGSAIKVLSDPSRLQPDDARPRTYLRVSNATMIHTSNSVNDAILIDTGADFALLNTTMKTNEGALGIFGSTTARTTDTSLEDTGPPIFRSVVLQSVYGFNGGTEAVPDQAQIFGSGTNNNDITFSSSLISVFVNGPNESAVPVTDPTPFNDDPFATTSSSAPNRMTTTDHIGAIGSATDTAFAGWTCNAVDNINETYANFGSISKNCDDSPQ